MRQLIPTLLLLTLAAALPAQTVKSPDFFRPADAATLTANAAPGQILPKKYAAWRLDLPAMQQALATAPQEFTAAAKAHTCTIAVPTAAGVTEDFAVWEIALLDPELAARHPYLHTYAGESLIEPGKTIRLSLTARGFRAMILRPDHGVEYVHPSAQGQTEYYLVFDRADAPPDPTQQLSRGALPDGRESADLEPFTPPAEARGTLLDPVQLKVYRYAAATTGEFAQDHGGTLPLVLSAVVEYTNDVSAIFERDIDLRLQLVPNNDLIIHLDPVTDPYSGLEVGDWMSQNPLIVNTKIGINNFDLGHVYARYIQGGAIGVAGGIGVACDNGKARGCSAGNGNGDYGPGFLVVIGQEVGHQLGGGHTWNRCGGGGGRNGNTAYEPGSGSTIMSYGGACGSDNVQGNSDLYYHAGSIEEIQNYYINGFGNQCGFYITTNNTAPVVTLPYQDNFFIPIGTPFELNGTSTDADGDGVTYCWEEIDTGPEVPLESPQGSSPIFRTWPPVNASNRYFPKLATVLSNSFDVTEQLPTYTRDMTFRLTARDNRLDGGGVHWADVAFKATADAGPFRVLGPNTASTIWKVGEYVQVTWDVANTDHAGVNCLAVNILLSTNGGFSWSPANTLSAATGNDGSQYILVPNLLTTTARVRIQAADNVFYDVSNANFKIQAPTQPSLTIGLSTDAGQICLPATFSTEVLTAGTLGFSNPVSLDIAGGLPPGATASFSANTLTPGQASTLTIDLNDVTVEGVYTVLVRSWAAGADTTVRPITLTLVSNNFSGLVLQAPADGSTGLLQTQTIRWQPVPDADAYDVQFANSPSFLPATILASKSNILVDTFKVPIFLEKGKAYFWRVRAVNECGAHGWSEAFFFSTLVENCSVWSANDLPKSITANNVATVESKINVGADGIISDLNVTQVSGYHDEFGQLEATLIGPSGTQVTLFKNKCGVISVPFSMALDDNAPGNFVCPPPNFGAAVRPQNPLAPFTGQNSLGQWILRVKDNLPGAGGTIQGFQLEFCASVSLSPPFLVNNNVLSIETGINKVITPDLLLAEDLNNTHDQLTFTLVTPPQHGRLEKNWGGEMQPGDQFTQAELDNGAIRYFDYGSSGEDYFRFTLTDGEGGFLGTPKFIIQPIGVGTGAPASPALDFNLFPNPATEAVWVAFGRPAAADTRVSLYDASGRTVLTAIWPAGADRLSLSVQSLPRGFYAVRVENAEGVGVKKLVVE